MSSLFVKDFDKVRDRWTGFWKGENTRPLVSMTIPKEGVTPVPKPPYTSGWDGNFEPVIDQILAWRDSHEFAGEAIPFFYLEFGPDHFSSLLGADMEFKPESPGTSWIVPFVEDWDMAEIRFREDCFWWKRTVDFIRAIRKRCDGKVMIAAPTFVASLDCLAAIRGVENLLMDLVICPDKVKKALDDVSAAYIEIVEAFEKEHNFAEFGSINRHGMYSTGRINVPQCDFSCMISPEMYREFEVPWLTKECQVLDAAEYHLDGPGAIKHLEALCSIEELGIVQWVPGAGDASKQDWSGLYQKIDALGKGQILGGTKESIKKTWQEFKSRKLFFGTSVSSMKEAEEFLAELEKI